MATHHPMTEHKVGTMDITHHQKTFAGFVRVCTWVVVAVIFVLIFLALTNA